MKVSKRLVVLMGKGGVTGSATLTFSPEGAFCAVDLLRADAVALEVSCPRGTWRYHLVGKKQRIALDGKCCEPIRLSVCDLTPRTDERREAEVQSAIGQNEKQSAQASTRAQANEQSSKPYERQSQEPYDDESVATENFYPSNLTVVTDEWGKREIWTNIDRVLGQESVLRTSYAEPRWQRKTEEGAKPDKKSVFANDKLGEGVRIPSSQVGRKVTFSERAQDRIQTLLTRFDKEQELEALMPDTQWVRVTFDEKGRYYLFGVIGDPIVYLCYGVPAPFSALPPSSLGEGARWLPRDPARSQGDGYWLLFQDAKTGKSVPCDW